MQTARVWKMDERSCWNTKRKALLRQREQDRMVAERHSRLMESQFNEHLASLTRRDEEREAEVRHMLTQVQQSELAQAARLASAESQAERVIQQQQRQHEKQVEDIQRDANRRITGKGKHTTTPTATPQKDHYHVRRHFH